MSYQAHPNSLVEPGAVIGARTRVWAFAHILPGAQIGEDCNICDHVFIEGNVTIGDRSTIKCGVQLWDGVKVGHDVFIGPNATFTNDPFPRSRKHLEKHPETVLGDGCSIGANATVLPGLAIGRNAMVGAGAVVTKSVPPNAIVVGNPAEIVGYEGSVTTPGEHAVQQGSRPGSVSPSSVRGVKLFQMPLVQDLRGDLSAGEFSKNIPFLPKRYFLVFDVKSREIRGEHAHYQCHQFLVCVKGSVRAAVDDGVNRQEFVLDSPLRGLYLPPMVWGTQYKYSPDAMLLVFASEHYDPKDYIRNYADFLKLVGSGSAAANPVK
jgi:acetyltransferase-like isoleucine patch superfamily enzyme